MQSPAQRAWWQPIRQPFRRWYLRRWYLRRWLLGALSMLLVTMLLVAFRANPAPQPQRVADLIARLDALEEENAAQQTQLDALAARIDALEATGSAAPTIVFDPDVTIPRSWEAHASSDGVLRYLYDPSWEMATDEPGAIDLWLDENTALFFTWDWSTDLVLDLHSDEEFLRFFEKDMFGSDELNQTEIVAADDLRFMGEEAHFWEVRATSVDGFASRMLTIFYPCSDRASCNITFVRYDPDTADTTPVATFDREDWDLLNTFAHGIEFQTTGKTTVTANANLRACPAVDCEITGGLMRGEIIEVVATSEDGFWYQLESGNWVASHLVFGAPSDLPIIRGVEEI